MLISRGSDANSQPDTGSLLISTRRKQPNPVIIIADRELL
jgi:hypothetical protein